MSNIYNFYANFSKNQGGFNPPFQNSGGVATPPTPPTLAPLVLWHESSKFNLIFDNEDGTFQKKI